MHKSFEIYMEQCKNACRFVCNINILDLFPVIFIRFIDVCFQRLTYVNFQEDCRILFLIVRNLLTDLTNVI